MIQCIIFDLDGVLVDCKDIHYKAFNMAIERYAGKKFVISEEEHYAKFCGLPTKKKLDILEKKPEFPKGKDERISMAKQGFTKKLINQEIKEDKELQETFIELRNHGYTIMCASNSVRETLDLVLERLGVAHLVSKSYSNQDVWYSKPHPEIYMTAMLDVKISPKDTLIVEDSHVGRRAGYDSGAHVLGVHDRSEVTLDNILSKIKEINTVTPTIPKWTNKKLNVLIPMGGYGKRFKAAGYTFPKPLIEVEGKPMIQRVVENLNVDARFIFIVNGDQCDEYNMTNMLKMIAPGCEIVREGNELNGAAYATLLAKDLINNNDPLLLANSDQLVEWDSNEFLYSMSNDNIDGGILTFESTHPKWSYAKVDENGFVTEVAEKNPISNHATVGVYYYKTGKMFIAAVEQMIEKNIRTNGEFYVCPAYNEIVSEGGKVRIYDIDKMWGLGTPEDLQTYLTRH